MTELPDRRMVDCLAYVKGLIMKDIISSIITSVLTALYQPLLVFCDPVCDGTDFFISLPTIMRQVEGESGELFPCGGSISEEMLFFGSWFFLTFYTTMILFRTLLNRDMWMNAPFGCDGELVDLEIWRGWYQISHN